MSPFKPVYFDLIPKERLEVHLKLSSQNVQSKVEEIVKPLILSEETYDKIYKVFDEQMNLGLMKNPPSKSCFYMLNTHIPEFIIGKEDGEYLAIDLGGTNFRVTWLKLDEGKLVAIKNKHYAHTQEIRVGPGADLFDFLANCIKESLEEFEVDKNEISLGFSFSFPMDQKALNSANLLSWCLNFSCTNVVGKDVVKMLTVALRKTLGDKVKVASITNDIPSVLIHGIYLDPRTVISTAVGTGTNACYIEKATNVNCWKDGDIPTNQKEVVIDIETCAFGDNGCLDFMKTEFDEIIAATTENGNIFLLEKLTGGNFLGELVRLVLIKLIANEALFVGKNVKHLSDQGSFQSRLVSECEKDSFTSDGKYTKTVLKELGLLDVATDDDIAIIRYVSSVISIRACRMLAICLANLIKRVDRSDVTVAVDGTVYKKHPKYHSLITHYIEDILPDQKFRLMLAEDGSCIGAGLLAAIAKRTT